MKINPKKTGQVEEADMTPMIDMVFQLIAFFMVLVNFTEAEQDQRITLPLSELAKPPDEPLATLVTLQLTKEDEIIFGGQKYAVTSISDRLTHEKQVLDRTQEGGALASTVVIRGDAEAKTGVVQDLIKVCQEIGFEKFALRAKQREAKPSGAT